MTSLSSNIVVHCVSPMRSKLSTCNQLASHKLHPGLIVYNPGRSAQRSHSMLCNGISCRRSQLDKPVCSEYGQSETASHHPPPPKISPSRCDKGPGPAWFRSTCGVSKHGCVPQTSTSWRVTISVVAFGTDSQRLRVQMPPLTTLGSGWCSYFFLNPPPLPACQLRIVLLACSSSSLYLFI